MARIREPCVQSESRHPLKKTLLDLLRTGVVITIAGLAALSAPASSQEPEHEGEIEGVVLTDTMKNSRAIEGEYR